MTDEITRYVPASYDLIAEATLTSGFSMASEIKMCSLLRTLATSKPKAKFLELGTGTGLSTAWILDGMDASSTLVSVDNDDNVLAIARTYLGNDARLALELSDGEDWVRKNVNERYDYIFADTWHGKYLLLDEVLNMLNPGGIYIIDDMLPQANWPEGHDQKAAQLLEYLDSREDLVLTRQCWASGAVVAVKKAP